ncbi:hypothetical protein Bca52824_048716 [Brassica carinata]|uniref:Anaphase-promoting complex subunit 4-like WD40 domain-containing protein n=1 Tax=Brassica carinata TaxID=52824 RepID=A0A8X7USE8_BRACI|nr:hypothetical protein Bca52824_048716 [Brassica carinata]
MNAGMNWKEHGRKIPKENLDRFIPNRSAMDFDFAHHALTEALIEARDGKKKEARELSPSKEAYRKRLAETLGLNRTRILAFRNKPQPPLHSHYHSASLHQQPLKPRRRRIPQSCSKVLDAPNILDDFYLNLLDWGSRNVLAIALGHTLCLWDASTGSVSEFVTIEEDQGPITSISWAPDGSHVALGLNNSQVQLWDSSSIRKIRTLNGVHHSRVGSLAWNNHILTTGGMDGKIVNNDVRIRSHVVGTYRGHTGEICGLKCSCLVPFQSNLLATGGGGTDGAIKFWNTHTGACLNSVDTGSQVCALLWSKNDRELLSSHGFSQNHLALWKYPSLVKMAELTGHTSRVLFMTQSPDGSTVASAAGDESLRFWDVFGMPDTAKKPDQNAAHEPFSPVPRIR